MCDRITAVITGTIVGLSFAIPAAAAGMSLGEFEYRNSCVQCHGEDGTGDGPVTAFLRNMPPDLTAIQKNNGGVFPVSQLYSIIEGSQDVGVHGRDMPLWGNRYRTRANIDPEDTFSPAATEDYVTTRVLALIEYLSTMQKD